MCGFYCITFIEYMLARKTLLDYTNSFSQNEYKKIKKQYLSTLKINMVKEVSLEFKSKKIDEARNYLLDVIKHNALLSEQYKKTHKHLNYVEYLLILVSTVTGSISISAFLSLVCVPVGIKSSAVVIKICVITAGVKKYKSVT